MKTIPWKCILVLALDNLISRAIVGGLTSVVTYYWIIFSGRDYAQPLAIILACFNSIALVSFYVVVTGRLAKKHYQSHIKSVESDQ